jgi:NADH dehydrogenase (ubiquinone) 1 beta subcomplex subunit 5
MHPTPSKYREYEMRDKFHFFYLLTAVPMALIIAYVKIRIGPAVLKEIPEGYVPEEYEYYKDPISRWMARVWPVYSSYVKSYERTLYYLHMEIEKKKTQDMMSRARELNLRREDVKGWYFVPYDTTRKDDAIAAVQQYES